MFYSFEDACDLSIEQVHNLFAKHINKAQVDLISSFGFGRDIVNYSEGCWIYTKNKKILDMTGGIGVLNHGHNHHRILNIRKKFNKLRKMEVHKNYFSQFTAALSHNLANILPKDLNVFFYPNSGAEAVDGALKMAYKYFNGEKKFVLHSDISFHGKLIGAGSVTSSEETSSFNFQKIPNVEKFHYNSISSVEKIAEKVFQNYKSDIYAIIVEPFNGQTSRFCDESFLKSIRKFCTEKKILLIFDEIYSGFCKTGPIFNFNRVKDLKPDILTFSKSFGGGKASISGYATTKEISKKTYDNLIDATLHSTTYFGFAEEAATALEGINILIEENYEKKSTENELIIKESLFSLKTKYPSIIKEIRGSGCDFGIKFDKSKLFDLLDKLTKTLPSRFLKDKFLLDKLIAGSIVNELYNTHSILSYFAINQDIIFKISPPIIINKDEINYFFKSLDKTLNKGILNLVLSFIKSNFFK